LCCEEAGASSRD